MTASTNRSTRGASGSKLHDQLARWIEARRDAGEIPAASDGWPDLEAWRDAAREDGFACESEDIRQAIRVCLLFRRIRAAKSEGEST